MEAKEFLEIVEKHLPDLPAEKVLAKIAYVHNGLEDWDDSNDENEGFREEVVNLLFDYYSEKYQKIIQELLKAELEYAAAETMMRETLRQLTFMLFTIGDVKDIPLLFEAKFDTCFDAGLALDVELIFGKDRTKTIQYFTENPHEEYDIVERIQMYDEQDNNSPQQFEKFMNKYYGKESKPI